ncbi:hypothetical protein JCM19237_315 [Photobacterium aphoticum]|uniref:Uncharacterized protein n=1 Tax=Photobacterium aphoticum TaxID=754436 RepID=A0A090QXL1_9GAMM|nr:hypothetical protein JCM19237_315 [Photobacterium aphoticum]
MFSAVVVCWTGYQHIAVMTSNYDEILSETQSNEMNIVERLHKANVSKVAVRACNDHIGIVNTLIAAGFDVTAFNPNEEATRPEFANRAAQTWFELTGNNFDDRPSVSVLRQSQSTGLWRLNNSCKRNNDIWVSIIQHRAQASA